MFSDRLLVLSFSSACFSSASPIPAEEPVTSATASSSEKSLRIVSLISPLSEVSLLQNIWANERLRYRADREQNRIQPDRVTLAPRFGRRGQSCSDLRLLAMAQLDPRGTFAPTQRQ